MADEVLEEFEKEAEEEEEIIKDMPSDEDLAKEAEELGLDKSAYTQCMKEQLKAGKSFKEAAKYCKEKVKKGKKEEEEEEEEEEEKKKKKKPKKYEYEYEQPKKKKKKPKEYEYGYAYPKKLEEIFSSVSKKLDEIINLVKQEKPEESEEKPEKTEETPKESEKASEETKVAETQDLAKLVKTLEERIAKLEKSPAPSKVVVSKGFVSEGKEDELKKIDARLEELAKIRDTDPYTYQEKYIDEAYALIKKRKELTK
ncbi:MAG: hypothetical protein ACTSYW_10460 [Candidatus Heimdallarchaeota archaeon]